MTIYEKSRKGRRAYRISKSDVPRFEIKKKRSAAPRLPELSEIDVVRHYTSLSQTVYSVDTGFYPLGSCTMKYNPKINEVIAGLKGFTDIHPLQGEKSVPGAMKIFEEISFALSKLCGMDSFSLQPAAGAHGEFTALSVIKAYLSDKGETKRHLLLVPDSAHGTNPASANMAGFDVLEIPSNKKGEVDLSALRELCSGEKAGEIAALMLTNPNTMGVFESGILQITELVHKAGGLLYYDGANFNAIMGKARPGDMGFDAVHLNLHKTFSTPHGGGGPGSGPIGVKSFLEDFLPGPVIKEGKFHYPPKSIGRVKNFYGHFLVIVRALSYIKSLGFGGLTLASEEAVMNANYLKKKLEDIFETQSGLCMHEFTVSCEKIHKETGVSAGDIAKALMDFGFHPPTVYFPPIVKEALMIEPPETEGIDMLDAFSEALHKIYKMAYTDPAYLKSAPHTTAVNRPDEVKAARHPVLKYEFGEP